MHSRNRLWGMVRHTESCFFRRDTCSKRFYGASTVGGLSSVLFAVRHMIASAGQQTAVLSVKLLLTIHVIELRSHKICFHLRRRPNIPARRRSGESNAFNDRYQTVHSRKTSHTLRTTKPTLVLLRGRHRFFLEIRQFHPQANAERRWKRKMNIQKRRSRAAAFTSMCSATKRIPSKTACATTGTNIFPVHSRRQWT